MIFFFLIAHAYPSFTGTWVKTCRQLVTEIPGQLSLALQRGWTRWSSEFPSSLNCSVKHVAKHHFLVLSARLEPLVMPKPDLGQQEKLQQKDFFENIYKCWNLPRFLYCTQALWSSGSQSIERFDQHASIWVKEQAEGYDVLPQDDWKPTCNCTKRRGIRNRELKVQV